MKVIIYFDAETTKIWEDIDDIALAKNAVQLFRRYSHEEGEVVRPEEQRLIAQYYGGGIAGFEVIPDE